MAIQTGSQIVFWHTDTEHLPATVVDGEYTLHPRLLVLDVEYPDGTKRLINVREAKAAGCWTEKEKITGVLNVDLSSVLFGLIQQGR